MLKYLMVGLFLLAFVNSDAMAEKSMQKQKMVLVKQQVGGSTVVVGLKIVPEFFEGSIENYCLELAEKLAATQSMIAFKPVEKGKAYAVVSLSSGYVTFAPFTDEQGIEEKHLLEAFIKVQ
ncbi:MAG: hypothetical protein R3E90_03820 [Marinicella sp.]|nr:hypothetical protein [Xanthomonadales bacterium]